ncbi:hypothetical protein [Frankia gtarii]|uniref:hypothetical protein n=1 Tax=Frankia gtarii TaxID=2950102 RepID=UPI0021BEBA6D|nr:hypothetical protein [Frankia gtarii]
MIEVRARYSEGPIFLGEVRYSIKDLAFDHSLNVTQSTEFPHMMRQSLTFDTLAIDCDLRTTRALYAWGYTPRAGWKKGTVGLPSIVRSGQVLVEIDEPVQKGEVIQIADRESTVMKFDRSSGWFECSAGLADQGVEIAANTIIGLKGDEIVALWLRPRFV